MVSVHAVDAFSYYQYVAILNRCFAGNPGKVLVVVMAETGERCSRQSDSVYDTCVYKFVGNYVGVFYGAKSAYNACVCMISAVK